MLNIIIVTQQNTLTFYSSDSISKQVYVLFYFCNVVLKDTQDNILSNILLTIIIIMIVNLLKIEITKIVQLLWPKIYKLCNCLKHLAQEIKEGRVQSRYDESGWARGGTTPHPPTPSQIHWLVGHRLAHFMHI